jgi:hypothetical protein
MPNRLLKTPINLYKSCRGVLDLQLSYLSLPVVQLQKFEKIWVKQKNLKHLGARTRATRVLAPRRVGLCRRTREHTEALEGPPVWSCARGHYAPTGGDERPPLSLVLRGLRALAGAHTRAPPLAGDAPPWHHHPSPIPWLLWTTRVGRNRLYMQLCL